MRISDWSPNVCSSDLHESCPCHRDGEALPNADADSSEPISSPARVKLMNQRLHQPRTRHAERMAKRDGSTVGIDLRRIIRDAKAAQYGKGLRRERLAPRDALNSVYSHAPPAQQFLLCAPGTAASHPRRSEGERQEETVGEETWSC